MAQFNSGLSLIPVPKSSALEDRCQLCWICAQVLTSAIIQQNYSPLFYVSECFSCFCVSAILLCLLLIEARDGTGPWNWYCGRFEPQVGAENQHGYARESSALNL